MCAPTSGQLCQYRTFAATDSCGTNTLQLFATDATVPVLVMRLVLTRLRTLSVGMIDPDFSLPDAKLSIYGLVP